MTQLELTVIGWTLLIVSWQFEQGSATALLFSFGALVAFGIGIVHMIRRRKK